MNDFFSKLMTLSLFILAIVPNSMASMKQPTEAEITYEQACVLREEQRYTEALQMFVRALEYADQENDLDTRISILWKMGNIHAEYGDYASGNSYFRRGYDDAVKTKNKDMQFMFAANLVLTFGLLNDAETAQKWLIVQDSIDITDLDKKKFYSLYNRGIVDQAANRFESAIKYHLQALDYAINHKMAPMYYITQYAELADIYISQKKPDEAIYYALILADSARKVHDLGLLREAYKSMEEAYSIKNDLPMSSKYNQMYTHLTDSIFNIQAFNNSRSSLLNYEKAHNDAYIDTLNRRITFQTIVTCAVSVIIILLILFVRNILRSRKKLKKAYLLLIERYREINRMHKDLKSRDNQHTYSDSALPHMEDAAKVECNDVGNSQIEENNDIHVDKPSGVKMSDSQIQDLWMRINEVMNDISIISDSNFGISRLASLVESNNVYVSYVINSVYGNNFKSLLHSHRINEVCRRLADTDTYGNYTIQTIYEELGYRSASNFIKAFKAVMDITPSEYVRLVRSSKQ